jgi:hypothetical protein
LGQKDNKASIQDKETEAKRPKEKKKRKKEKKRKETKRKNHKQKIRSCEGTLNLLAYSNNHTTSYSRLCCCAGRLYNFLGGSSIHFGLIAPVHIPAPFAFLDLATDKPPASLLKLFNRSTESAGD